MSNQVAENKVDFGIQNKNLLIFQICYILIKKLKNIQGRCSHVLIKTQQDTRCRFGMQQILV